MNNLLSVLKIISIAQLCLIFLLILSLFFYKIYLYYNNKHKLQWFDSTKKLLNERITSDKALKPLHFKIGESNLINLLSLIKQFDELHPTNAQWLLVKNNLFISALLPKARHYSTKRGWYKRYFATQVFQQLFQEKDLPIIQRLISDPIPLIALNAAQIAVSTDSKILIATVIQFFAKNRLLQNALFIQAIQPKPQALALVAQYLDHEKDIYVRVFCYQLLQSKPGIIPDFHQILTDMNSENMDLRIAALTCYVLSRPKNLFSFFAEKIKDSHWQIRAKIASLMGKVGDNTMCTLLAEAIKDTNWWVRINAAESLYQLGSEGIHLLKNQNPDEDRFAYETAARVLASAPMKDNK